MDNLKFLLVGCLLLGFAANAFSQGNVFTDPEGKFSIELPEGWVKIMDALTKTTPLLKSGKIYSFGTSRDKSSSFIYIAIMEMTQAKSLKDAAVDFLSGVSRKVENYSNTPLKNTVLNGIDCITTTVTAGSKKFDIVTGIEKMVYDVSIYYFLKKGNTVYVVNSFSQKDAFEVEKPILEKALSTFKIIE
ncbi:MAG: hypothetical protein FJZ11_02645 [Candidatus Omnitrophica bacterium]|nr:hypothetical protein [Candidatus Omnitrophota bacterium]MBM3251667.1 hypothetical protein [Candidatus Omnitrophota bacterium]